MSYFSSFSYIKYPNFEDSNNYLILKDITTRIVRIENLLDDSSIYYEYVMTNEEDIEDVSYKLYGTTYLYWTIMLINNRFDRFYDFPLNNTEFENYIIEKYGSIEYSQQNFKYYIRTDELQYSENTSVDDTFFFEVTKDSYDYISQTTPRPIYSNGILMKKIKSLYDYELDLNENKRTILVLNKNYVTKFVNIFNSLAK